MTRVTEYLTELQENQWHLLQLSATPVLQEGCTICSLVSLQLHFPSAPILVYITILLAPTLTQLHTGKPSLKGHTSIPATQVIRRFNAARWFKNHSHLRVTGTYPKPDKSTLISTVSQPSVTSYTHEDETRDTLDTTGRT
jgi:hypothetical protein